MAPVKEYKPRNVAGVMTSWKCPVGWEELPVGKLRAVRATLTRTTEQFFLLAVIPVTQVFSLIRTAAQYELMVLLQLFLTTGIVRKCPSLQLKCNSKDNELILIIFLNFVLKLDVFF